MDVWLYFHRKSIFRQNKTDNLYTKWESFQNLPTIIFTPQQCQYMRNAKIYISHQSDPHLHVAHGLRGFYGKTILPFVALLQTDLLDKNLINRKKEQAGGKESIAESLRMMIPSRREAHLPLFLHHLPAVNMNQPPQARSKPLSWQHTVESRGERGVKEEVK